MAKGYLSTDDFLAGILGESVDYEVAGLGTIKLRSLEMVEVQKIRAATADDIDTAMQTVIYGMVEPKLSTENLAALGKARPGVINQIGRRIMELSGMVDDDEKKAKTPGSGS